MIKILHKLLLGDFDSFDEVMQGRCNLIQSKDIAFFSERVGLIAYIERKMWIAFMIL